MSSSSAFGESFYRRRDDDRNRCCFTPFTPFRQPWSRAMASSRFRSFCIRCGAFVAPGLLTSMKRRSARGVGFKLIAVFTVVWRSLASLYSVGVWLFTAISLRGRGSPTDISSYLDFVLALFFAFGIAFEVPVAILSCYVGRVQRHLKNWRSVLTLLLGAFIVGIVLTPLWYDLANTLLAIRLYSVWDWPVLRAFLCA